MRLGYNTNGFAHHQLVDAIRLLAEFGYKSVAITLDHHSLNPFSPDCLQQAEQVSELLARFGMGSVIETGARFLLNPAMKHEPTLVSPEPADRQRRVDFLCRAVDLAARLESDCVSLWSGILRDDVSIEVAWSRLLPGLETVLEYASERNVRIGFEPEPGMFIDRMTRFEELVNRIKAHELQLTLDIGHLFCLGEGPIPDVIRQWSSRLVNVHLEDMRRNIHEHLMFGQGEVDFPPILSALRQVGFSGGVHVELSRHSHEAPSVALESINFLRPLLANTD